MQQVEETQPEHTTHQTATKLTHLIFLLQLVTGNRHRGSALNVACLLSKIINHLKMAVITVFVMIIIGKIKIRSKQ